MNILDAFMITKPLRSERMIIDTAEVSRDFLGKSVPLRVKYVHHYAKRRRNDAPGESEHVEIISITTQAFSPAWTANKEWINVPASPAEEEEIANEILESL